MRLQEDPLLYNTSNKITRRDATFVLSEYGPKLTWNKGNLKVIDIGCADGSVTEIIERYIPENYETLIGCDISSVMIKFANEHYSNERRRFTQLDITAQLPSELRESFGHAFCLYVFHWVREHEIGFRNIYNLLSKGGECLMSFLGNTPFFQVFISLSNTEKWGPYMKDIYQKVSLYHDCQSPEIIVTELLKNVGFNYIDVRCKQVVYVFENEDELKNIVDAVNPFQLANSDMYEEFLNAYVDMVREMKLMDETMKKFKFNYNLFVVHCIK